MASRSSHASAAARAALLLVMVAACAACGRGVTSSPGDAPNLEKWVAEVKNRPAPPLEPLPVMQQFETFEYDAQTLRDPRALFVGKGQAGDRFGVGDHLFRDL